MFAAYEALRAIDRQGKRRAITSAEQFTALATQTDAAHGRARSAKLETLAEAEAATLAATAQVVKGREEALQTLLGELDAAGTDERYRIVLDSVSETDAPWLLESALHHGLRAEEPAMRRHAWLRLLQSEFIDTPRGQTVLAEHIHTLEDEPVLLTFLVGKLAPKMATEAGPAAHADGESALRRSVGDASRQLPLGVSGRNERVGARRCQEAL